MKQFFTLLCVLLFLFAQAQKDNKAGTLDSSFGINGKVIFSLPNYGADCFDAASQHDGKIICVGSGFAVTRFTTDGTLDTKFGTDGLTNVDFDYGLSIGYAIAVQPDDKIVVTGYGVKDPFDTENTNYDILTARLNADGSIDSSFGKKGTLIADYGKGDIGSDIAIQSDGKIIIQGSSSGYFNTIRYLPDGTLDESFGNSGSVITKFSGSATGSAVSIQPDGKIIAAGSDNEKILLARYMPDGSFDKSFGANANGTIRTDVTKHPDVAEDMVLQPDGKIVIAGYITAFFSDGGTLLLRYNPEGSLDSTFGIKGIVNNGDGISSDAKRIALQKDGKMITAGDSYDSNQDSKFFVSRFKIDGSVDSSFGINGNTSTGFLKDAGAANGLIIQNDNKIVLAGYTTNGDKGQIALARYNNDEVSTKQILITKIKRWLQHHNGFTWNANSSISSYIVQRSYDGIHFSSIGRINAGNASNAYADPSPLSGNSYYRLQTTSVDGAVAYSNVLAISYQPLVISISPNPAKNNLQISGLSSSTKTKITIVDFMGNIKLQAVANASSYNLNVAALTAGNYVLKMEMNGDVVTKQFVKE